MQNYKDYSIKNYVYGFFMFLIFLVFIYFIIQLFIDTLIRLGTVQLQNTDIINSIIVLIATIVGGSILSKKYEYKYNRQLETYKEQKNLLLTLLT